jgi:2-keto-4-pentenoate hydratase/2-oxohepta-3-ene-1,7-dioic acid hydratase in catechol pathway
MFCVGVNYQSHFDEGERPEGTSAPDAPVFFTKPWTALIGHDDDVVMDRAATSQVDWEAEIAVVIGTGGVGIAVDDAFSHVFGYTLANDVSARDLQLAHGSLGQWFKGKSLDRFCPMGPAIVTADELCGHEDDLHVQLRVNGVVKQDFSTRSMINSVPRIISRLSLGMELLPGDVILTGTAAGVGYWRDPKEFLHGGDVVEITSERLGLLRSHFVEWPSA